VIVGFVDSQTILRPVGLLGKVQAEIDGAVLICARNRRPIATANRGILLHRGEIKIEIPA
jgi:hypothetical protein